MDAEELKLRQKYQELYDSHPTLPLLEEAHTLQLKLIQTYGWARGKKMPNGRFNMLEKP